MENVLVTTFDQSFQYKIPRSVACQSKVFTQSSIDTMDAASFLLPANYQLGPRNISALFELMSCATQEQMQNAKLYKIMLKEQLEKNGGDYQELMATLADMLEIPLLYKVAVAVIAKRLKTPQERFLYRNAGTYNLRCPDWVAHDIALKMVRKSPALWLLLAKSSRGQRTRTLTMNNHLRSCQPMVFKPDGSALVTSCVGKNFILWDLQQCEPKLFKSAVQPVTMAWSRDGSMLAVGAHDSVEIWDMIKNKRCIALSIIRYSGGQLLFSPDNKKLIMGGYDRIIRIWDIENGLCEQRLIAHAGTIRSLDISRSGRFLVAVADNEKTVSLWDLENSTRIQLPTYAQAPVPNEAFFDHETQDICAMTARDFFNQQVLMTRWDAKTKLSPCILPAIFENRLPYHHFKELTSDKMILVSWCAKQTSKQPIRFIELYDPRDWQSFSVKLVHNDGVPNKIAASAGLQFVAYDINNKVVLIQLYDRGTKNAVLSNITPEKVATLFDIYDQRAYQQNMAEFINTLPDSLRSWISRNARIRPRMHWLKNFWQTHAHL